VTSAVVTLSAIVVMQIAIMPRAPRFGIAVLFNVLAILSIFAHAEVVLRHAYPEYVVTNLYTIEDGYYFNKPLLAERFHSDEYSVTYSTNAQGFRMPPGQDPYRAITEVDWLVIGDSFTQGAQVEFEDLFSSRLNGMFPDRVVVNAGVSGLGVGQEYNYFVDKGQHLNPDLVILQLGSFNDFMNVEPGRPSPGDRLMSISALARLLLASRRFGESAELPLGRWTEPFSKHEQQNIDFNIFYNKTSALKQRDTEQLGRYLRLFKGAVEMRGGKLLVVLLPSKEQVHDHYLDEVLRSFSIDRAFIDMQRPNKILGELTQALGIEFLDTLPAFKTANTKLFFDRDEHLAAGGHAVMASAIAAYVKKTRGQTSVSLLSRSFAGDRYPMLSQDGSQLVYQSPREGKMELFLANPDLSDSRRLTYNDVDESHPMLSRDNSRVIFTQGDAEALQTDVVIANVDGSQRTVVTAGPYVFGAIPSFSPSNTMVTYAEWTYDPVTKSYSNSQIVVQDLFSGRRTLVTSSATESWRPVFSPDAKRLLYISKSAGQFDVHEFDLTSGVDRQLTHTSFDEWDPQFCPSGDCFVYSAHKDNNWDLFRFTFTTGEIRRLTQTRGDEWDPSVSPDGGTLLFAGRFGLLEAVFKVPFAASGDSRLRR
jgi:Tol biopolymer transport system component/lysophospholipase L1-like esterase